MYATSSTYFLLSAWDDLEVDEFVAPAVTLSARKDEFFVDLTVVLLFVLVLLLLLLLLLLVVVIYRKINELNILINDDTATLAP